MILKNIIPNLTWATIKAYIDNALTNVVVPTGPTNTYIEVYDVGNGSETSFGDNNYKLLVVSTITSYSNGNIVSNSPGLIVNQSGSTKTFKVEAVVVVSGTVSDTLSFVLYKNGGAPVVSSTAQVTVSETETLATTQAIVRLSDSNTVALWVKNVNATNAITLLSFNLILTELPDTF